MAHRLYNRRRILKRYATFKAKSIVAGDNIKVRAQMTNWSTNVAWIGTAMLLFGPYLLQYKIGFILNAVGIILLTPQVFKAKQWNLVFLNVVSSTGYWLQIFNII